VSARRAGHDRTVRVRRVPPRGLESGEFVQASPRGPRQDDQIHRTRSNAQDDGRVASVAVFSSVS